LHVTVTVTVSPAFVSMGPSTTTVVPGFSISAGRSTGSVGFCGSGVGDGVGVGVGVGSGVGVGVGVGSGVGESVGSGVGESVGSGVGESVGDGLGELEVGDGLGPEASSTANHVW
jgi:hypothetical protein